MPDLDVKLIISALNRASGPIKQIRKDLQGVGGAGDRASKAFALAGNLNQASLAAGRLGRTLTGALRGPIEEAGNFEFRMARVRALTSDAELGGNFKRLSERARELGRTTKFTAIEAAEGMEQLAIAGFNTEQQLDAIGPALQLAIAGGTELGRTADIVTDLMGGLGLQSKDTARFTDLLTATFTNSTTTLETLFETMKLAGPIMKNLNVPANELAAVVGTLGSAGLKGSIAGTALRASLLRLADPTKKTRKELRRLRINLQDAEGQMLGPTALIEELRKKMQGLDRTARTTSLARIFGRRAVTAMMVLFDSLEAGEGKLVDLNKISKVTEEAFRGNGVTAEIAAKQMDTYKGSVTEMSSAMSEAKITTGLMLTKSLRPLVQDVTKATIAFSKWAQENPGLVKGIASTLAVTGGLSLALSPLLQIISTVASTYALYTLATMKATAATGAQATSVGILNKGFWTQAITMRTKTIPSIDGMSTATVKATSKFGLFAGAVGAFFVGYQVGRLLDDWLGISDAIANSTAKLKAHNLEKRVQLALAGGAKKKPGRAPSFQDMTPQERENLSKAQADALTKAKQAQKLAKEERKQRAGAQTGRYAGIGAGVRAVTKGDVAAANKAAEEAQRKLERVQQRVRVRAGARRERREKIDEVKLLTGEETKAQQTRRKQLARFGRAQTFAPQLLQPTARPTAVPRFMGPEQPAARPLGVNLRLQIETGEGPPKIIEVEGHEGSDVDVDAGTVGGMG